MNQKLRIDAEKVAYTAINAVMPEGAVRRALLGKQFPGRVFLIAVGKAAPRMAQAALSVLSGARSLSDLDAARSRRVKGGNAENERGMMRESLSILLRRRRPIPRSLSMTVR